LARPGSNITGLSDLNSDLAAKRFEILHELIPSLGVEAFLQALALSDWTIGDNVRIDTRQPCNPLKPAPRSEKCNKVLIKLPTKPPGDSL
jgi:hypothetical protein